MYYQLDMFAATISTFLARNLCHRRPQFRLSRVSRSFESHPRYEPGARRRDDVRRQVGP